MEEVKYDFGFMFKYSERPGTLASNIDERTKQNRLSEIINLQQKHSLENLSKYVGTTTEVLIENESRKSNDHWAGRNEQNIMVVFPKKNLHPGELVEIFIESNTATTLIGKAI